MNSDTPKGGIATPESPPLITQMPQTARDPIPASYPPYQHSYPPAPYRYPPVQPRKPSRRASHCLDHWWHHHPRCPGWFDDGTAGGLGRRLGLLRARPA